MTKKPEPPASERERIKRETLAQLRRARATIDPALLERARASILAKGGAPEDEKVSRAHMLETVKSYLLLKKGDKSISQSLASMLSKDKNS